MTKPCEYCRSEFNYPQYRAETARFCSRKCNWNWYNEHSRTPVICAICGRGFNVISCRTKIAKYCSRKCYYKAMHLKGTVRVTCKHCSKEFLASPSQKRIYCSRQCINKVRRDTWVAKYTTVRKKMIRTGRILHCERCGFASEPRILGVHHKDRNRHNNALDNLEVLCPNCHSLEHLKHIAQGISE